METTEVRARVAGYEIRPMAKETLRQLRERDDAGRLPRMVRDDGGGSPLRCCFGRSEPGEVIAFVSYAPLRRWAAETGADPGPYDEVGPVFLHPTDCGGPSAESLDGFPAGVRGAQRVLRAYTAGGDILLGRRVAEDEPGALAIEHQLAQLYDEPRVAVVHVRALEHGCFLMETRRW